MASWVKRPSRTNSLCPRFVLFKWSLSRSKRMSFSGTVRTNPPLPLMVRTFSLSALAAIAVSIRKHYGYGAQHSVPGRVSWLLMELDSPASSSSDDQTNRRRGKRREKQGKCPIICQNSDKKCRKSGLLWHTPQKNRISKPQAAQ